ncbi:IS630 family transposase [Desulfoluna spongiiphila]|uniref:IS630 family transposase n=1 Tax=Desulfoluna spongiiphila TaxID=419481 RepID=UPI0012542710|nr:IS630 family transposase [Desulfoluna spongiiphila]VVS93802.1 helix-turn-helix domain [Desulfoluna spongiiphila]VVS95304.1 helix-turn-helix domain [Desulfoluna spongiiphila]
MKKSDARQLDHKTREAIRIRAIQRVEAGESPEQVIKSLGYHRSCIYEWLAKYNAGGIEALKTKKITGRPTKFKAEDLCKLYHMIVDKDPLQYKFVFALWTREMIQELIDKEFKVSMSLVSVGRLLKKLGLTPQKPLRKAYQRNEELVTKWRNEDYPKIRAMAKQEKATIYFGDESTIRSDYHSGTTWAPKGKTPVVETTGARFSVNMISAISPKGSLRFKAINGKMNASKFIDFLKSLRHGATNPIYLIVDGHPVHKSSAVKKYVESTDGMLKLFLLPPYSPHLNPDELVWSYLKHHKLGKVKITGPDQLKKKVYSVLRSLQKMPHKLKNFFKEPNLKYASTYVG